MPTRFDMLALDYLDREARRAKGEFTISQQLSLSDPDYITAAERSGWNVTAADMADIDAALKGDQPFTDPAVETKESKLDQINDAVRRMKKGDVSKYNHVPQFLREYFGRKALTEFFGPELEFPPLDDNLKKRLNKMTVRPEFRDAICRLADRGAVDRNGSDVSRRLQEYTSYLNERMMADTLKPVSEEAAQEIRKKYPGSQSEKMLAENREKQCFLAKTLLMAQLGRMDIAEESGTRRPYDGSTVELFSHGLRVAFNLPRGAKKEQDLMYDAWRKNAIDADAMTVGRFASHEMHRRQVNEDGKLIKPFEETRIQWKKQLKALQFNKKVTTYFGNYGMNVPVGGMGTRFNGNDCVDDRGGFGHVYIRTRKGDQRHCGAVLMGFENSQPNMESSIGQLHSFKAVNHDLSPFFSSKSAVGKKYGGREADLTHMDPADLTAVLNQFQRSYRALQEDPAAAERMDALNRKLCGKRLTAPELTELLSSLGVEKENALRCVSTGRSPEDAGYTASETPYREDMYMPGAENTAKNRSPSDREKLISQILNLEMNNYPESTSKNYLAYSQALRELNSLMNQHSELDEEIGLPKELDSDGKQKLMESIRKTARLGDTFLKDIKGPDVKTVTDVPAMVIQLQKLLFDDYEALNAYNPLELGLSFPEIQENARTQIVDFRGLDLKRLSGAQSARLAMTVVDEKGERREGVFTKASYMDSMKQFTDLLDRAAECPGAKCSKEQLDQFLPKFRDFLIQNQQNLKEQTIREMDLRAVSNEQLVGYLSHKVKETKDSTKLLQQLGFDAKSMGDKSFRTLRDGLNQYSKDPSHTFNGFFLQLKQGDRLDQRNSAMSAVASLLGVPKLVARAENMKYLDENGSVQEGTFMEFSKGMDFRTSTMDNLVHVRSKPFTPPAGIIRSIADLQILDYVCGNLDRHAGNMTYFTDEKGVFSGVQAIDNDSSFGTWIPDKSRYINRLGGIGKLQVISASMADKVRCLSPDMLRFALRGRGLQDKEIEAACSRLSGLQTELSNNSVMLTDSKQLSENSGKLCVVPDQHMPYLDINQLSAAKPSIFNAVTEKFNGLLAHFRVAFPYDPKARREAPTFLKEVGTTDRRYVAGGIADSMQSMSAALSNPATGFRVGKLSSFLRSSDEFRSMVRRVKDAKATAERIRKEIGADKQTLDRNDYRVREQLEKANLAMQKVRQASETYLKKKAKERGVNGLDELVGKNDYEKARIAYARKLLKDVQDYETRYSPQSKEHSAERESVNQRIRIDNARKEKPKPGSPKV